MLPHDRKWQETRLALADRAAGKGYVTALYHAGRMLLDEGGQESQALARLTLAARGNEPNALKLLRIADSCFIIASSQLARRPAYIKLEPELRRAARLIWPGQG